MTTEKANQSKDRLRGREYVATSEELLAIDAAMASIDTGEIATEGEIRTAFAKFRSA